MQQISMYILNIMSNANVDLVVGEGGRSLGVNRTMFLYLAPGKTLNDPLESLVRLSRSVRC